MSAAILIFPKPYTSPAMRVWLAQRIANRKAGARKARATRRRKQKEAMNTPA